MSRSPYTSTTHKFGPDTEPCPDCMDRHGCTATRCKQTAACQCRRLCEGCHLAIAKFAARVKCGDTRHLEIPAFL